MKQTEIKYDKRLFVDPQELRYKIRSWSFINRENLTLVTYYDSKRVNSETIEGMVWGL